MAPTETNTWYIECSAQIEAPVLDEGTQNPLDLSSRQRANGGKKKRTSVLHAVQDHHRSNFEPGFNDILQQMWAAFPGGACRHLGRRFGCATPDEAVASHGVWSAALESHSTESAVAPPKQQPSESLRG